MTLFVCTFKALAVHFICLVIGSGFFPRFSGGGGISMWFCCRMVYRKFIITADEVIEAFKPGIQVKAGVNENEP